ncbi:MFS transporter [Bowmanella yangjiangensis]|uniref:MFS transporter n=1 Tax=Bowmanella yangjiangensis TaxID=2811230 RepID=A0ABS3CMM5_9ALTE|nr:MFS transporter [Bowmanella yangjiangensis]MBN7818345.1 MFS transporter [Bowmanella yangjiangensis]
MSDWRSPKLAVSVVFLFNGALFGTWASRIPSIKQGLQLSASELGMLLLLLALGAILAFPLAGSASDRLGAAKLSKALALLVCPALIVVGIADNVIWLAVALFVFGAVHGALDIAMNSWASEVEKSLGRSTMSFFHAMFSVGAGLGAGLGSISAWLALHYSVFFILATLILLPLLWLCWIPWQFNNLDTHNHKSSFQLPRGSLLVIALVALCCAIGEGAMADWSAVYLSDVLNSDHGQAALGYALFSVAMVTTRLMGDRLVNKIGATNTVRFCGVTALLGSLLLVASQSLYQAYAGLLLLGVGYSIVMPLVYSNAANNTQMKAGAGLASVATFGYGGMLLGPPLIGFVAEWIGLRQTFALFALLAAVVLAGAWAFNQDKALVCKNQAES